MTQESEGSESEVDEESSEEEEELEEGEILQNRLNQQRMMGVQRQGGFVKGRPHFHPQRTQASSEEEEEEEDDSEYIDSEEEEHIKEARIVQMKHMQHQSQESEESSEFEDALHDGKMSHQMAQKILQKHHLQEQRRQIQLQQSHQRQRRRRMAGNVKESPAEKEGKKLVRQGENEDDQKSTPGGSGDKTLEHLPAGDSISKQARVKSFFKKLMHCLFFFHNGHYLLGSLNLEGKKAFSTSTLLCTYS